MLMLTLARLIPSLQIVPPPLITAEGQLEGGDVYCCTKVHAALSENDAVTEWTRPSHGIFERLYAFGLVNGGLKTWVIGGTAVLSETVSVPAEGGLVNSILPVTENVLVSELQLEGLAVIDITEQ